MNHPASQVSEPKVNAANSDLPLTEWPVVATLPDSENDPFTSNKLKCLQLWLAGQSHRQWQTTVFSIVFLQGTIKPSVAWCLVHCLAACTVTIGFDTCENFWSLDIFNRLWTRLRLAYYWGYNLAESSPGLICLPLSECFFFAFWLVFHEVRTCECIEIGQTIESIVPIQLLFESPSVTHC